MNDRSATYNNAGVRMMEIGNESIALELFRGALESKLAFERSQRSVMMATTTGNTGGGTDSHQQLVVIQRCVTPDLPDCLDRAEIHLANLDTYLNHAPTIVSPSTAQDLLIARLEEGASVLADGIAVPIQCRGYDPFLHKTPFTIPQVVPSSTQVTSSVIVFNLGLVHQCLSRTSPKTAAFYEISAALLASMPESPDTNLLRIALLNNFGVWCFENGDGESMRTCMEHLLLAMEEVDGSSSAIDSTVKDGVRSNIQWLLTPLNGGSPAA